MEGMQDQLAVESSHHDQIAVETNHHGNPIPVPVPIEGGPGTVILPIPPNFHPQQQQSAGRAIIFNILWKFAVFCCILYYLVFLNLTLTVVS